MEKNIKRQYFFLQRKAREDKNQHKGKVIWLTGLSCSGKSTLANALEKELFKKDVQTYILDGDNMRMGLNQDLNFTREGRKENLRRVAEVAKLFCDAGMVVISAFITPLEKDREMIRQIIGEEDLLEVYVNSPLSACETRDVKGYYAKARRGEIKNYTGIDAPFEQPLNPDLEIDTYTQDKEVSIAELTHFVEGEIIG